MSVYAPAYAGCVANVLVFMAKYVEYRSMHVPGTRQFCTHYGAGPAGVLLCRWCPWWGSVTAANSLQAFARR